MKEKKQKYLPNEDDNKNIYQIFLSGRTSTQYFFTKKIFFWKSIWG
jgi:hypothetical protein